MKNKKIVAWGDLHGRTMWKDIVKKESNADLFISLGDYFDTHDDISVEQQLINFNELINYKKANIEKIILLLGNHCFHYLSGISETYSSYQASYAKEIGTLLDDAIDNNLIQMCFKHDKYFFSHAGVTKTWSNNNKIDLDDIENSINNLFKTNRMAFSFTMGSHWSNTGDDIEQTPIWVRLNSLAYDIIPNIVCVVGHTPQRNLYISGNIIAIDTLGESGEYLIIENNIPKIGK